MKQRCETEVKLRVKNLRQIKQRLRKCGFVAVIPRHFERNVIFDLPDRRLTRAGHLLRLRWARKEATLTFKGMAQRSARSKTRFELEARVPNGEALAAVFLRAGFQEVFRYEKFRTVYRRHLRRNKFERGSVMFDETPLGAYLELEGSQAWIDRTAHELGFGFAEYITASYGDLYRERCRARRWRSNEMTFRERRQR